MLILFLSIIITTFNRGFFSFPALAVLVCLYILLLILFFKKLRLNFSNTVTPLLSYFFVVTFSLFIFFPGGIYQSGVVSSILLSLLPLFFFPVAVTYILDPKRFSGKNKNLRFIFLIGLAALLRILIIIASPKPVIDVFTMLGEGTAAFLHGQNPYTAVFSAVYPGVASNYYTYWPVSFLLQIPFVFLFADPRVLLVVADVASAILLYFLGRKSFTAEILALIYLFRPNSNFIIEQSWLTPLVFFLTVLAAYIYKRGKNIPRKGFFCGIILGLAAGIQPHFLLLLPAFLLLFKIRRYILSGFLLTFSAVVVPFFLWSPQDFLSDTVGFFLRPTGEMVTVPVHQSLNINTAVYLISGRDLPVWILYPAVGILAAVIFWQLRQNSSLPRVLLGAVLLYFSLFLFLRFSFINYYYLATGFIILWLTASVYT